MRTAAGDDDFLCTETYEVARGFLSLFVHVSKRYTITYRLVRVNYLRRYTYQPGVCAGNDYRLASAVSSRCFRSDEELGVEEGWEPADNNVEGGHVDASACWWSAGIADEESSEASSQR